MTLVLNWASPGPSEYAPSGPHFDFLNLFIHRDAEREREREAETQAEGEAGSMQGA